MYIVYNAGYRATLKINGKYSKKRYVFKKRFVTEVEDSEDANAFLEMTSRDIQWCPDDRKDVPPFMTLKDWCAAKEGRIDADPSKTYDPQQYKNLFLLK